MIDQVEALKAVINAIPGYVSWVSDDLVYLGVNEALARAYGLPAEDFIGKPINFLGYSGAFGDYVAAVFRDEAQQKTEILPIRFPRAPEAFYSLSIAKYDQGRKAVVIGIDVSALKKAQAIIQDQQVQIATSSRMSALGEVAESVAHEMATPLSAIAGFASQLKTLVGKDASFLSQEQFRLVDKIAQASTQARHTIDGFKRFAKDGKEDGLVRTKVSGLLEETLCLCREKFRHFQINLDVGTFPESVAVQCRPSHVSQVLLHLFNNALDAIGDQSGSQGATYWVKVEVGETAHHIQIRVSNNGPDIPMHLREKILQPFFSTKAGSRGNGLGLTIARKIMLAHGGDLVLDAASSYVTFALLFPKIS